jgi:hypothetical protein
MKSLILCLVNTKIKKQNSFFKNASVLTDVKTPILPELTQLKTTR